MSPLDEEFEEFVASVSPRLFRAALAISGDHQTAEDAVQAGLIRAYSRWAMVCNAGRPEAYVRKIVVHELFGWRRRRSAAERPTAEVDPGRVDFPDDRIAETDAVWSAITALPPRQRAVIVLRYYEQLSEAEIAEALGCRRGTVKSQASDALRRMRELLAGHGHDIEVGR